MGMIGNIVRVSQSELEKFIDNSELFENLIYDDKNFDADWFLDLDKAWEGIQFILTGSGMSGIQESNKLSRAFFSFQILDEEQDLGYGPVQYLTAEEVKEINSEIQKIDQSILKERIDGEKMMAQGIYPSIWTENESIEYLTEIFIEFKEFYQKATENNEAILSFIN